MDGAGDASDAADLSDSGMVKVLLTALLGWEADQVLLRQALLGCLSKLADPALRGVVVDA